MLRTLIIWILLKISDNNFYDYFHRLRVFPRNHFASFKQLKTLCVNIKEKYL